MKVSAHRTISTLCRFLFVIYRPVVLFVCVCLDVLFGVVFLHTVFCMEYILCNCYSDIERLRCFDKRGLKPMMQTKLISSNIHVIKLNTQRQ